MQAGKLLVECCPRGNKLLLEAKSHAEQHKRILQSIQDRYMYIGSLKIAAMCSKIPGALWQLAQVLGHMSLEQAESALLCPSSRTLLEPALGGLSNLPRSIAPSNSSKPLRPGITPMGQLHGTSLSALEQEATWDGGRTAPALNSNSFDPPFMARGQSNTTSSTDSDAECEHSDYADADAASGWKYSLMTSLMTSTRLLAALNPNALAMLVLLGLLPGGILSSDAKALFGDGFQLAEEASTELFDRTSIDSSDVRNLPPGIGRPGRALSVASADGGMSLNSYQTKGADNCATPFPKRPHRRKIRDDASSVFSAGKWSTPGLANATSGLFGVPGRAGGQAEVAERELANAMRVLVERSFCASSEQQNNSIQRSDLASKRFFVEVMKLSQDKLDRAHSSKANSVAFEDQARPSDRVDRGATA